MLDFIKIIKNKIYYNLNINDINQFQCKINNILGFNIQFY